MTDEVKIVLDRVIWRDELQEAFSKRSGDTVVKCASNTVRRWIIEGKLPKPDVNMSGRTKGWKVSTLRAAGINMF